MDLKEISSYKDIGSLDHHLVIEASAGTGKTYTIENLVVRLLEEKKDLQLEQILLVTFTEKATNEMRDRIRKNLQNRFHELKNNLELEGSTTLEKQAVHNKLLEALTRFDDAPIHTIHGFCQSILQQYAFENSKVFELELTDDDGLYERLLHEQQRTHWLQDYGTALADILKLSEYPRIKGDQSDWERTVLSIAKRWQPEAGDILKPDGAEPLNERSLTTGINSYLKSVRNLLGNLKKENLGESPICEKFGELKIHSRTKQSVLSKILIPLLELVSSEESGFQLFYKCYQYMAICKTYSNFQKIGFEVLVQPSSIVEGKHTEPFDFHELANTLSDLQIYLGSIRNQFTAIVIYQLKKYVKAYKARQGLLSFNDMITQVAEALDPEKNAKAAMLLEVLRSRFQYAIVDEFQDTDRIQWSIFRKIFFEDNQKQRLFLIGDPKQAIYGFRGADVETYLLAKKEILGHDRGRGYTLNTNWRSIPRLTSGFNQLFADPEVSWFNASGGILCHPVNPKEIDGQTEKRHIDQSHRSPISIVELADPNETSGNNRIYRYRTASFIAKEIKWLVGTKRFQGRESKVKIPDGTSTRELQLGDICILIRGKSDLKPLEVTLRKEGIPYTHYKKPGLYTSQEAGHLVYLLSSIADPKDHQLFLKALLTCFFRVPIEKIETFKELPGSHPTIQLFKHWTILATKRRWSLLFQSILEDTGVLLSGKNSINDEEAPRAPRSSTNLKHILQNLEKEAVERQLDISGLVEHLKQVKYRNLVTEIEADLHQLESEKPMVKIMTIHAAKGLQFPIVFLAGGFTKNQEAAFVKYHNADGKVVYDLTNGGKGKNSEEENQEDRRNYYVALTRAIYKIYLPKIPPSFDGKMARFAGPLATLIGPAVETLWPMKKLFKDVGYLNYNEGNSDAESGHFPGTSASLIHPFDKPKTEQFVSPKFHRSGETFKSRKTEIHSFTNLKIQTERSSDTHQEKNSLTKSLNNELSSLTTTFGNSISRGDPEKDFDFKVERIEEKDEAELPKGKIVGTILHEILEEIDYGEVNRANAPGDFFLKESTIGIILEEKLGQAIRKGTFQIKDKIFYLEKLAEIVFNTLKTPLTLGSQSIALCDPRIKRVHEIEFYYPIQSPEKLASKKKSTDWKINFSGDNEYLNGFIDLVFSFNEKFYLLDWKSNYLEGYGLENLKNSMDQENYHLQYQIYALAFKRWLSSAFGQEKDFQHYFGGIFYLYLRGLNRKGDSNGIFFQKPSRNTVEDYESNLFQLLNSG